jgi:hypothetical protein
MARPLLFIKTKRCWPEISGGQEKDHRRVNPLTISSRISGIRDLGFVY